MADPDDSARLAAGWIRDASEDLQRGLDEGSPAVELVRAMSRAMEELSKRLTGGIRAAVREDI
jgi:hypothetical protein